MIPRSHSRAAILAAIARARAQGSTVSAEEHIGPLNLPDWFLVTEAGCDVLGPDDRPIRYSAKWIALLDLAAAAPVAAEAA